VFAIAAALKAGEGGRVYAVEPSDYNRDALELNVQRNDARSVRIVDRALADGAGETTFYLSSATVASSLVDKSYAGEMHPVRVLTTTIDEIVRHEPADQLVMKLDLEGAEERALLGATQILSRCRGGRVIVEHNPAALRDAGSSGERIVELLREAGFEPLFIDDERRELIPVEAALPDRKGNLLADKAPAA
jgi:FkbM family methyltransferase